MQRDVGLYEVSNVYHLLFFGAAGKVDKTILGVPMPLRLAARVHRVYTECAMHWSCPGRQGGREGGAVLRVARSGALQALVLVNLQGADGGALDTLTRGARLGRSEARSTASSRGPLGAFPSRHPWRHPSTRPIHRKWKCGSPATRSARTLRACSRNGALEPSVGPSLALLARNCAPLGR